MGCCQDRMHVTNRADELRPLSKAPPIYSSPKVQLIQQKNISIVGDLDRMEMMDEVDQKFPSLTQIDNNYNKQTSIMVARSTKDLVINQQPTQKLTQNSETVIIDMRSGTLLPSPLKPMSERRSSRNLNQKFIEML